MGNGMNKVLPGLYVGNFRDSKDQDQLSKHNITHVLAIHDNARKLPCNNDKEYLCIIASDSPGQNLLQFFPVCNEFIHSARIKGGNVLIHCLAGMSRSVTVSVVYVMCVTSLRWRDALKAVQGARNVANPNVGFMKQLHEFEKERLNQERRRLREKYPEGGQLTQEDEEMAKELLTCYYHYMSVGEMCDGNCQQGVACPRGLCNQPRSGIFRRNSRESGLSSTYHRSLPSEYRSPSPPNLISPKHSPDQSRNSSPTIPVQSSNGLKSNALTPPISPYNSRRNSNLEEACSVRSISPESPNINKNLISSSISQPTPPGSPSRSYSYYTSTSKTSVSLPSLSNRNNSYGSFCSSPARKKQGKIIHCPSTPPSPIKTCRNKSQHFIHLTPPNSPSLSIKDRQKSNSKNEIRHLNPLDKSYSASSIGNEEISVKKIIKSSIKANLMSSSPHRNIAKLCKRESKSLDLSSPPSTPSTNKTIIPEANRKSVPSSPSKRLLKPMLGSHASPSRFCQVVTKYLPHMVNINNASKANKYLSKTNTKLESSKLYVDERGRSTLKPSKFDTSAASSSDPQPPSGINTFDDDEETKFIIFEMCKSIQKLPKECEINYEPTTNTVGNDIVPEGKSSLQTTIDISSYTNSTNTNIIINPIFSLENKYEAESLCNNKVKYNGQRNFSAFLEDDMIYVETSECKAEDNSRRNDMQKGTSNQLQKDNFLKNDLYKIKEDVFHYEEEDAQSQKVKYKIVNYLNQHIPKQKKSEFNKTIPNLDSLSGKDHTKFYQDSTKTAGKSIKHTNCGTIKTRLESTLTENHISSLLNKFPPPVPPRKVEPPSKGSIKNPPPVPPRKIKTQVTVNSLSQKS